MFSPHPQDFTSFISEGIRRSVASVASPSIMTISHFHDIQTLDFEFSRPSKPFSRPKVCSFCVYAPVPFQRLRRIFGLSEEEFVSSVSFDAKAEPAKSSGKSHSFFLFTSNQKMIIKSISRNEFLFAISILPDLFTHFSSYNDTLINRLYGIFKASDFLPKKVYFVILENISDRGETIFKFDLKGSTLGREASTDESDFNRTMKDLEFSRKKWLRIGSADSDRLIKQLRADISLLSKLNVMDYSLLVLGIISMDVAADSCANYFRRFRARGAKNEPLIEVYCMSIIDYFQEYTTTKQAEHEIKTLVFNPQKISCVSPPEYGRRLLNFLRENIILSEEGKSDAQPPPTFQ